VSRGFEAIVTLTIDAPRAKVWDALINPAKVKKYMHGTYLSTDWKVGSPIAWTGEWKGKSYADKGTVLAFEPQKLLKHTLSGANIRPTRRRPNDPISAPHRLANVVAMKRGRACRAQPSGKGSERSRSDCTR
jgi:hypothetical protein